MNLPCTVRIFVAVAAADLRKGFDSLAQMTREVLEQDPLSGHLFVFTNRRRDRLKILYWDRDGYAVWMKRLEKGRFAWPVAETKQLEWTGVELAAVLGGLDLKNTTRRSRYALQAS